MSHELLTHEGGDMSSRPFLKPFSVVTNGSMGASITSAVTIKNQLSLISYSASWTGTPTGTFSVEVSDDYLENVDGSVRNAGTWNTLPLSAAVSASGSTGNGLIDVQTGAYAIRLVYTRASGTGTLNAIVTGLVM